MQKIAGFSMVVASVVLMLVSILGVLGMPSVVTTKGISIFLGEAALGKVGAALITDNRNVSLALMWLATITTTASILIGIAA